MRPKLDPNAIVNLPCPKCKIFLESLPEYTTTQDLAEVARFMENHPE